MAKSTSESSVYESKRGGVLHSYDVRSDGLYYTGGTVDPTHLTLFWKDLQTLKAADSESVFLLKKNGQKVGIWLEKEQMEKFLSAAIAAWGKVDKTAARKVAFDYGTRESSVGWIWFALAIGFPGLLCSMLLSDGYHTLNCTRAFERNAKITNARLVDAKGFIHGIKKNRRGNFIWNMEFKTESGQTLHGVREAPITTEIGGPPGGSPTVIYSPENPQCWDLSLKHDELVLNERQRHFITVMDLGFGWMFFLVSAIAIALSILRIRQKNPFREAVRAAGEAVS